MIVIESAVMVPVLVSLTPSSSKKGWLELITVDSVTPPVVPELVTVRAIVVLCVKDPLVPVTVTLAVPVAAVLDAAKVTLLVPVVDAGLKLAVTPVGKPLAARATVPVKPFSGLTVMVLLADAPWATERLAGLADREKFGG